MPAPPAAERRAGLLGLVLLAACTGRSEAPPLRQGTRPIAAAPDIVLITVDTLRADHLGPGYPRPTMPWLTGFSESATVYSRAIAPSSWTLPTLVSLATGLPVPSHTVDRVERELPASIPTLAEQLGAAGYQTAFFGVNPVLLVDRGPTRGFSQVWTDRGAAGGMLNQALAAWLATGRRAEQPLFLHLHYYEPHCPYRAPGWAAEALAAVPVVAEGTLPSTVVAEAGCYAVKDEQGAVLDEVAAYHAAYDAELRAVDRALGAAVRTLEQQGVRGLWAISSDHGESLGEHGVLGHSKTLWEPELHVPLVVRWPGQQQGAIVDHRVGLVQLHGALLAVGTGQEPELRAVAADQDVLATTTAGPEPWEALYAGRQKLLRIGSDDVQTIDLDADPDELRPSPGVASELDRALEQARQGAPPPQALSPSAEELELLRALGYTF